MLLFAFLLINYSTAKLKIVTTKTLSKPINLQTIALKLLNNERIVSQLEKGDKVITAKDLASKIPSLSSLGNMPLIQLRSNEKENTYLIPSIYQKDGQCVITLPDINASITEDFEICEWQAGDVNRAIIRSKKYDVALNAAIIFTRYILETIQVEHNNRLEGVGSETLEYRWLKPAPEIELPLRSLPIDTVFTILGESDRRSKQYNTQLLNLKDNKGKVYKNVITNADLRHLYADGCQQFKIIAVETVNVEDRKNKKGKIRTSYRVLLEPFDGADFSDF